MLRLLALATVAMCASGQSDPFEAQYQRLMGEPKELVNILASFPWKSAPLADLPGLRPASPGQTIRIVSVERPMQSQTEWKHWQSADGAAWLDIATFSTPYGPLQVMGSARQPHSGYQGDTQLLLFSGTESRATEAVGTAFINGNGTLVNIGVKLGMAARRDRPLRDADRAAFDAALSRFQGLLEALARNALDPGYVDFGGRIAPRPDALPILRMAGFAKMWSLVKYNFVYLDRRPGLNWDAVLEEYMARIARAKDDIEYGKLLQRAIALLHDGHTNVYPNSAAPQDAPAITLEPIESKAVATIVGDLPELAAIRPGMELLEIDGTPVKTIIERDIDPYVSSSSPQDRELRWMRQLLAGAPGSRMQTKWLTPDGKTVEVALPRDGSEHRGALKFPSHPRFEHRDLPGGIAYIGLSDFNDAAVNPEFDAQFDRLREAKAWIIDLRWNGGGSSGIGYKILAHFIERKLEGSKQSSRVYNPTLAALGDPQTWHDWETSVVEPAAGPHYAGPVYVLTSPHTCSAAEDFLLPLRTAKRITIVGEPSCGSTGQPLPFIIYGATGRICTKWDRFPDGTEFVGPGVVPDVKIARTKQDIVSGRDPVLERAIALASK
jgi:C-terminal processing protease CtpA/Prc